MRGSLVYWLGVSNQFKGALTSPLPKNITKEMKTKSQDHQFKEYDP
jgi:hypothetical protein